MELYPRTDRPSTQGRQMIDDLEQADILLERPKRSLPMQTRLTPRRVRTLAQGPPTVAIPDKRHVIREIQVQPSYRIQKPERQSGRGQGCPPWLSSDIDMAALSCWLRCALVLRRSVCSFLTDAQTSGLGPTGRPRGCIQTQPNPASAGGATARPSSLAQGRDSAERSKKIRPWSVLCIPDLAQRDACVSAR